MDPRDAPQQLPLAPAPTVLEYQSSADRVRELSDTGPAYSTTDLSSLTVDGLCTICECVLDVVTWSIDLW